jgi:hypothetical protein
MNGTVFTTRWKYAAKRWVELDPPCNKIGLWDSILGIFIIQIGCDGYLAESGKKYYPAPNEIVEYTI